MYKPTLSYFQPMDTDNNFVFRPRTGKSATIPLLPEVEIYLHLLLLLHLIDNKQHQQVRAIQLKPHD